MAGVALAAPNRINLLRSVLFFFSVFLGGIKRHPPGRVHTAALHAALNGGVPRFVLASVADMRSDGFVPNISLYNKVRRRDAERERESWSVWRLEPTAKMLAFGSVLAERNAHDAGTHCTSGSRWPVP